MTTENNVPRDTIDVSIPAAPAAETPARPKRRRWLIGTAVVLAGIAGVGAVKAASPWGGPGFGPMGWHRGFDPARAAERVDFGVDLMLGRVQANDEQKKKVAGLIKSLLADVPSLREGHEAARDKLVALLKADRIDRTAIEQLRAERIKVADDESRKIAGALADAAETLTPKQRNELIDFAQKHRPG